MEESTPGPGQHHQGLPPGDVRRMFDRIARRYDLINSLISFGLHRFWKRRVALLSGAHPGIRALDVCAGTGDIATELCRLGAEVVAVDFSPGMISVGRARARGLPIRYVQADALLLPFPDRSFDIITVGFSLRNLASRRDFFTELGRVVRPGGRVVVLETSQPPACLLRRIYHSYLHVALALAGLLADRDAYRYLGQSIISFPPAEAIAGELRSAGFHSVWVERPLFGVVAIHIAARGGSGRDPAEA